MPGDNKTEKATPKRRRDERKKGNVFMSNEIVLLLGLLGSFSLLKICFPGIVESVSEYMNKMMLASAVTTDFSFGALSILALDLAVVCLKVLLPIFIACIVLPVLGVGVQTRFLFTAKNFAPKFSKLNPLEGIKKMFALRNVVELLKNMLKTAILVYILYTLLLKDYPQMIRTMDMDLSVSIAYMLNLVYSMVMTIILVYVVIAGFDFMYQKWDYERRIKMSKQEIKEEFKETEGNPEIKGRIKTLQRQMSQKRMMQAVPDADVIIRNPTHYAVALKYDSQKDMAPQVVAKGQDELALRIVSVGEANKVAVVENKPLARALYAECEVGSFIPSEYYGAVAEVLVYVYKLNEKWSNNS